MLTERVSSYWEKKVVYPENDGLLLLMITLFSEKTTMRRLGMKTEASILENSAFVSFKQARLKLHLGLLLL